MKRTPTVSPTPAPTLSRTLSLSIGGGLLALSLLLGLGVTQGVTRLLDQAFQDKAEALARQLATISLDALLISDYGTLERYLSDLQAQPGVRYLQVRRSDGEILGEVGEATLPRERGDQVQVQWPISIGAKPLGDVTVSYDRAPVQAAIRTISLQWAGGLLVLMTALYFWLNRTLEHRLIRPIQRIARQMTGARGRPIDPAEPLPRELARIAEIFARLCTEIEEQGRRNESAERLARHATERLCREQRLASIGQMAAGLAHGLNTPLGNIIGYAQQAFADTGEEQRLQRLRVIEDQARVCAGIVRDLLDAVHPPEANPRPVDLVERVDAVIRLMEPILRDRGVVQVSRRGEAGAPAWADPSCIEQVLFNLLSNAVDAGATQLKLRIHDAGDRIHLDVEDNGTGIPAEICPRLFDAFVTSKARGKGSGLGLHICKTLLLSTGGDIVLSRPGPGGTAFRITWRKASPEVIR